MTVREWLRPPGHLLVAFAGITLVLGLALGLLGWRLVTQDRAAGAQRVRDRLERAANRTSTELLRRIAEAQRALAAYAAAGDSVPSALPSSAADLYPDGLVLTMTGVDIAARPDGLLLYHPVVSISPAPDPEAFRAGEAAEFRQRNYPRAAAEYRRLSRSGRPSIRAGALLRLGRVLRRSGRPDDALGAYAELATVDATPVDGLPAALLAAYARCSILESLGRTADLRTEATRLAADLMRARWRLSRSMWTYYAGEVSRWTGTTPDPWQLALTAAAVALWDRYREADLPARRVTIVDMEPPILAVWSGGANRAAALLAGPGYLRRAWLGPLSSWLDGQNAAVTLIDAAGRAVVGGPDAAGPQAVRTAADVDLPWTVRVTLADPAREAAASAARERQLVVVLLFVAVLFVVGMYFIGRAVTREIAVARLQADFVATVSHEFRTPLTSMRQFAELLASGRVPDEARRLEYYRLMARESERLQRLVENLLEFGRMEAGAEEFRFEPADVGSVIRTVVEDFRAERGSDALAVSVAVENADVPAPVDRDALGRAVWNLLDNALKYSPPGSAVVVDVRRSDGRVCIDVRDAGIGIPAGEHDGIFERFVRGAAARQAGVKGTGIGLAMVRHIVEAHGGTLSLRSVPDHGSTFTISLPAKA